MSNWPKLFRILSFSVSSGFFWFLAGDGELNISDLEVSIISPRPAVLFTAVLFTTFLLKFIAAGLILYWSI